MTEFFYGMTLADQIDGFRKDRQRLAEENAKLRDENVKLRELIWDIVVDRLRESGMEVEE